MTKITLPRLSLLAAFVLLCVTQTWPAVAVVALAMGLVAQEAHHNKTNEDVLASIMNLYGSNTKLADQIQALAGEIKDLPQLREMVTQIKNRGGAR